MTTIQEKLNNLKILLETDDNFECQIVYCKNDINELMEVYKSISNHKTYINFNTIDMEVFEDDKISAKPDVNIYMLSKSLSKNISPDDLLTEFELLLDTLTDEYSIDAVNFDNYSGQYYYIDIKILIN